MNYPEPIDFKPKWPKQLSQKEEEILDNFGYNGRLPLEKELDMSWLESMHDRYYFPFVVLLSLATFLLLFFGIPGSFLDSYISGITKDHIVSACINLEKLYLSFVLFAATLIGGFAHIIATPALTRVRESPSCIEIWKFGFGALLFFAFSGVSVLFVEIYLQSKIYNTYAALSFLLAVFLGALLVAKRLLWVLKSLIYAMLENVDD